MSSKIVQSSNVLCDYHTFNVMYNNNKSFPFLFKDTENSVYIILKIIDYDFILINPGFNPFCFDKITETTEIIVEFDDKYYEEILKKRIKNITNCNDNIEVINMLLEEEEKTIATLRLGTENGKYYLLNPDVDQSDQVDRRLIVNISYMKRFLNLPVINYRQFQRKIGQFIFPKTWDFMNVMAKFLNGSFRIDLYKDIEFSYSLFSLLISNGRILKHPLFNDVIYLYFFDLDDLQLPNDFLNPGKPQFNLFLKIKTVYQAFIVDFLNFEFKYFREHQINKVHYFKFGEEIIGREDPEYELITRDIIMGKTPVTKCFLKNIHPESPLFNKIICEVYPHMSGIWKPDLDNITSYELATKIINFNRKKKNKNIPQKIVLSQEEIDENISQLLMEEEMEKEKLEKKKMLDKQKKDEKERKEIEKKHLKEIKEFAKKIALEAREFVVKRDVQRKREETKHNNKMKEIAKIIAVEAKVFLEQKKSIKPQPILPPLFPTNPNNSFCEIGSPEYLRRINEWNISKICPQIYCYPIEKVSQIFVENIHPQNENLWMFDFWK